MALNSISIANLPEADITNLSSDLAAKAPINNPSFTGIANSPQITTNGIAVTGSVAISQVPTPTGTPTGTPGGSGTLVAGSNYCVIVAVDGEGNTTSAGTESSAVTSSGSNGITWNWTVVASAISYRIYVGSTSGGESFYYTSTTNSYFQSTPITAGTSGTPPNTNSTGAITAANIVFPNVISSQAFETIELATPTGTPTGTPSGSGGTIAAGSNFAKIVAVDAGGYVTLPGTQSATVTTSGSTSSIAWSWTAVPGATSYQIWVATTTNTEANYFTSLTNSFTQTLPKTSGVAGTLPTVNSTGNVIVGGIPLGVIASGSVIGENTLVTSAVTQYTVLTAGWYRITGCIYATTASSTAFIIYQFISVTMNPANTGSWFGQIGNCQVGVSAVWAGSTSSQLVPLAAGATIKIGSQSTSGSNTSGVWNRFWTIERLV